MPRKKLIEEEVIEVPVESKSRKIITSTRLLVIALLVASYFLGVLTTKVSYLEQNGKGITQNTADAQTMISTTPQISQPPKKVNVGLGSYPVLGDKNAKVTIVEFADLRCPFCEQFFTNVKPQLMTDYVNTGKVKFVFRNYAFLGQPSVIAANAAACANDQGDFWTFHDYIYKNQPVETDTSMFTVDNLTQIAGQLGMDTAQFQSCLSANKNANVVNTDFADGQKAGVTGTPTFFINGTMLVGALPYDTFKTAIDKELAK